MGKIAAMKAEILGRLTKKPETELYPFEAPKYPDGLRGTIEFNWKTCMMCGACARYCPAEAIEMVPVSEKRKAPVFYQDRCVYCGQCEEVCPPKAGSIKLTKLIETAGPDRKAMKIDFTKEKTALLKEQEAEKAKAAGQA